MVPNMTSFSYDATVKDKSTVEKKDNTKLKNTKDIEENQNLSTDEKIIIPAEHIKTPEKVKALYMSSWVAGTNDFKNSLISMIDETELNAVVIDIKDSTGKISFEVSDPILTKEKSVEKRIPDIASLVNILHSKNIQAAG